MTPKTKDTSQEEKNILWYGDCLNVMRDKLTPKSVDLIYLDPPFNSDKKFNTFFKDDKGRPFPDQVDAFKDIWVLDAERERQIENLMESLHEDDLMKKMLGLWEGSLRTTNPKLLAYLFYMAERLMAMKELLKPTGSIYFHCDQVASHYIKACMDIIFGHENFRNEIIWRRTKGGKTSKNKLPKNSDHIFFYVASDKAKFHCPMVKKTQEEIDRDYHYIDIDPKTGKERRWASDQLELSRGHAPASKGLKYTYRGQTPRRGWMMTKEKLEQFDRDGKIYITKTGRLRRKRYLDELGEIPKKAADNIWTDIRIKTKSEDLGYDTQKPKALLKRIIEASSKKGDLVLDPFCGCATTIDVAHELERRWIGIDISYHAINAVSKLRLKDKHRLVDGVDFDIDGIPRTIEEATDLWSRDTYNFQRWAVHSVLGLPTKGQSGDRGIDGKIYLEPVTKKQKHPSMVLEVKGGKNVTREMVSSLRGVMERENEAVMAGLIVLKDLGETQRNNFLREMRQAGSYEHDGKTYDRMQLLSVREILAGTKFNTPEVRTLGSKQHLLDLKDNQTSSEDGQQLNSEDGQQQVFKGLSTNETES